MRFYLISILFCVAFADIVNAAAPHTHAAHSAVVKSAIPTKSRYTDLKIAADLTAVKDVLLRMELTQRENKTQTDARKSASWYLLQTMFSYARAEGEVACIDNGIIAKVASCTARDWSNIKLSSEAMARLQAAGIKTDCEAGTSPCATFFGYRMQNGERSLFCAKSSTRTCSTTSATEKGAQALAHDLSQCAHPSTVASSGSPPVLTPDKCRALSDLVASDAKDISDFCTNPPPTVTRACRTARVAVSRLRALPAAVASEAPTRPAGPVTTVAPSAPAQRATARPASAVPTRAAPSSGGNNHGEVAPTGTEGAPSRPPVSQPVTQAPVQSSAPPVAAPARVAPPPHPVPQAPSEGRVLDPTCNCDRSSPAPPGAAAVAALAQNIQGLSADAQTLRSSLISQGYQCADAKPSLAAAGVECVGNALDNGHHRVHIYIPRAFQKTGFALAYHIHGYTVDDHWRPKPEYNPFSDNLGAYGKYLTDSGKNALLIIPDRPGENDRPTPPQHTRPNEGRGDLAYPAQVNSFFEAIDKQLNAGGVKADHNTPRALSGHSGADFDLANWANMAASGEVPDLQSVRSLGMFYTGYKKDSLSGLKTWANNLASHQGSLFIAYDPAHKEGFLQPNNIAMVNEGRSLEPLGLHFKTINGPTTGEGTTPAEMYYMRDYMAQFLQQSF